MTPASPESPGDALAAVVDAVEQVERLLDHHADPFAHDPDDDAGAQDAAARDLFGEVVADHGHQDTFDALQDLLDRFESTRDQLDGTDAWSRLDRASSVVSFALEIAEEASLAWANGEGEYDDPTLAPGDDVWADAARYFQKRDQQWKAMMDTMDTTPAVLPAVLPAVGARPRARGAGNPAGRSKSRSSSRGGDSGDSSGSSEGGGDDPPLPGEPDQPLNGPSPQSSRPRRPSIEGPGS